MPNTVEIERGTLTEWMEARNISVRQLAARAGVTTQAVYRWRHGDCRPIEVKTVYRILGVEEGQIIWTKREREEKPFGCLPKRWVRPWKEKGGEAE